MSKQAMPQHELFQICWSMTINRGTWGKMTNGARWLMHSRWFLVSEITYLLSPQWRCLRSAHLGHRNVLIVVTVRFCDGGCVSSIERLFQTFFVHFSIIPNISDNQITREFLFAHISLLIQVLQRLFVCFNLQVRGCIVYIQCRAGARWLGYDDAIRHLASLLRHLAPL